MNVFDTLKKRGYIEKTSNESGLRALLGTPGATIYEGFDPTAKSLQIGQLSNILVLKHLQDAGHKIIFLVGGGTGLIGDPTDKAQTRPMLSLEELNDNANALKKQAEKLLLRFEGENAAIVLNNADWIAPENVKNYLRNITSKLSVNYLLTLETFKKRLDANQHLSLMEFLYPSLQGWDYLHLFEKYNCRLQIGGSDQWANIITGVNLVQAVHKEEVFALTWPLMTDSAGVKIGKTSSGGKVWLDPSMSSAFDCYQFLQTTDDTSVEDLLKRLTFLPLSEISEIVKNKREAQKRLAFEVTKLIHGDSAAKEAEKKSESIFGNETSSDVSIHIWELKLDENDSIGKLLVKAELASSKSDVKRLIDQKGITINEIVLDNSEKKIIDIFGSSETVKIQKGKRKAVLLKR